MDCDSLSVAVLGSLAFVQNTRLSHYSISLFDDFIGPFLNKKEREIDLFLNRLSVSYLELKTAFLQLVAYLSSEILRRTAHYLTADSEFSRKLASMESLGEHTSHLSYDVTNGVEKKYLPVTEATRFIPFSDGGERIYKKEKGGKNSFLEGLPEEQQQRGGTFMVDKRKPYERIHLLRQQLKQQSSSRRTSSASRRST
eukprot:jgi/Galph1/4452/GphlegSOOS_G3099.1